MKVKRIVLAKGNHWFYSKEQLQNETGGRLNLIGVLDSEKELICFKNLPQSQSCRLVLEIIKEK